jgi:uncharacterized tellurite resistance protein B-like protein
MAEADFQNTLSRATDLIQKQGVASNLASFFSQYIAPALPIPDDRISAYRYAYAMTMINLNVDPGEQGFLDSLKSTLAIPPTNAQSTEQGVLAEFATFHKALAATILGLIIIAADGQIKQEELDDLKADRTILDPIAALDDTQFDLVYDVGVSIYNRFLMDANNRRVFLYNVIAPRMDTPVLKQESFQLCADLATADGDLTQTEIDTMKDILTALQLTGDAGDAIFNQFMARVKTIDGQPVQQ